MIMDLQHLPQLEALCERLYNAENPQERSLAEQHLRQFGQSTEYISHCKAILDNSRSPYAQLLASSSLLKVVTEHSLSPAVRLEMRTYFLTYLDSQAPNMEGFVVTSVVQLLCRTIKLAWNDNEQHRTIADDCKRFLEKGATSPAHYLLGLKILNMLVTEMNQATPGRTLTQHRKIAVSFRDLSLFKVFQLSLVALKQLLEQRADDKLKEQALQLALSCLSFDFVGTCLDDSTEDLSTIQVPTQWRPVIEEPATLQLFLDYYGVTTPPLSSMALECLVRLASVRRSLFLNETERTKFLNRLVAGTRDILRTKQGLNEHANYHEFCRLLGRLKTNYQLSELVAVENYVEWIQQVAELTISSLNSWQWASGSVYYLLGLWARLVSSMPYLKGDSPSLLETNVPKITQAYITSRLESVSLVLGNAMLEDLLDNEEQMAEQLDSLPFLCRFQYDKSAAYICALMDPMLDALQGAASGASAPVASQLVVLEGQLAWMVYIVGAVVRGRLSSSSAESQEAIDGDLATRVFRLLSFMDEGFLAQRYGEKSRQRLDAAVISFFQSFRRVYIGEQMMHTSKVYTKLGERLGLTDHLMVLSIMLRKIATNLKVYGAAEDLVFWTLTLFSDLASGYMSGKLLLKLEVIGYILAHHTGEHYAFLEHPANARNRTLFYATLARLLFTEDSPHRFKTFVAPLTQVLHGLVQASTSAGSPAALRAAVPQHTVVGLFRDLRGIAAATHSRRTYALLFDWLYPAYTPALLSCLGAWADAPAVTTPLLKFVAEFCYNKSQRLAFESSSPNGILLFREVSKVLVTYGSHVLSLGSVSDVYATKYKGIWICLLALARAMSGNYVNFGVFELYGDAALKDALDMALRMVLSIPLPDMIAYPKLSRAYFSLLEVLCHNHTAAVAGQDLPTFSFIVASLDLGLKSLDVTISSSCAAALDNLAAFYFRHVVAAADATTPAPAGASAIAEHMRQQPMLFPEVLKTLFETVLFEECANQWSLSRPMLSLILINEQIYNQLKMEIIAGQSADRRAHLSTCLDRLMTDVQRNLEPKNRDKFTQNLTIVRHDYRSKS